MSLETQVQAVVTTLKAAGITRGDDAATAINVIDYDPLPGGIDMPGMIAVTFGGMSDTDWHVLVRLYVDGAADIPAAEKFCRSTTPALDVALDTVPSPRTTWEKTWSIELTAYVVETALAVGRDDF